MFTLISPVRNLNPVHLSLNDYNIGITAEPRNPIPFNAAGSADFACQPGICAIAFPYVSSDVTRESYGFCGIGYFGHVSATSQKCSAEYCGPVCPIADSNSIMARLDEAGARDVGVVGLTYIRDVSLAKLSSCLCAFVSSQIPCCRPPKASRKLHHHS